jgi:DNA-directed RNA polymerase specialized sigma subunit
VTSLNRKSAMEREIENRLRFFETYKVGMKNCEQQLEYIMPSLVSKLGVDDDGSYFFIPNDTEKVALDRIESKRALDLKEEIEHFKLIISSIENSLEDLNEQEREFVKLRYFERLEMNVVKNKMGYSEEKSVYRIRKLVLSKLMISLKNLLTLKSL